MVDLRGVEAFNPNKIPELEEYLARQVAGTAPYDLDANVALFRLYALAPERASVKPAADALALALKALPSPDGAALVHLLPEAAQDEQPLAALIALTQHLEACRFAEFWEAAGAVDDVLKPVAGLYDSVKAYVLACHAAAADAVPLRVLAAALKCGSDADAAAAAKAAGWAVDGAVARPPRSRAAPAQAERAAACAGGGLPLDELASVIALAR